MEREGVPPHPPPPSSPTTATTILGKYRLGRFLGSGSFAKRYPSTAEFLGENADSVQAVAGNTKIGTDTILIGSLPRLRIVMSYSMGLDKIDMRKYEEREIMVTNNPDKLTYDIADKAIGLILAVIEILLQWLV
ncbi:Glyoxylate reductase [Morus notabilis]|uniref:Glyoxylate reductase n=1 Tax=Morus notabilis TaxID=981085 RepID=W9QWP8_9ROSA|nr:Glyoxylate reductase [Morus notabilis]